MATSLVQVAAFASPLEAEHLRLVLEQHGVASFIDGANTASTLSHIQFGIGGARLLVAREDADRAREVLQSLQFAEKSTGRGWYCGKCQVDVDPGFEVCWSCGEPREQVEQPRPPRDTAEGIEPQERASTGESPLEDTRRTESSENPYASPLSQGKTHAHAADEAVPLTEQETEAILLRALRAAIIGLIALPIVLNFYSMYLLVRASLLGTHFSTTGTRRFYFAWTINLGACLIWGLAFSMASPVLAAS